jgi:riboflavin synthase
MFTGIVEARGRVAGIEKSRQFKRLRIRTDMDLSDVRIGDSISVDGACLTATTVDKDAGEFTADVSPETARVTTLGQCKAGDLVNLERALKLGERLGGHFVLGHVDCVGQVAEKRPQGAGVLLGFVVSSGRYLIEKGSVAIDGVSLTVNSVDGERFWVMIIPHTAAHTGLLDKKVNDKVNVEFDMIGKYIEKLAAPFAGKGGLDEQTLRNYGFM